MVRKWRWLSITITSALAFLLLGSSIVIAIDVSVSATVEGEPPEELDTIVAFSGLAYPGASVTVRQNGSILATTTADPQANFNVSKIVSPGNYTYTIFAEDANGVIGRSFSISLSLTEGTTTTISGIFLGPTISTDDTLYSVGDTVTIFGISAPNSTVSIYVSSHNTTQYDVSAGGDGTYSRQLLVQQDDPTLHAGDHTTRSKAAKSGSISEFSNTIAFAVEALDPCAGLSPGDINCDGFVNLVDFSIMLFYWQQTSPANARADVNSDGVVNITDFSIMLFYWTG